jgi:hypothetical protein
MASTARQTAREFWTPRYRRALAAFAGPGLPAFRAAGAAEPTARALANAGLAALLLLPLLLLASLVLDAPLAVPAAIALGYLAMAHAIEFRRPRRAAALSAAVLTGFVAWTLLVLLIGEGPLSWGGLIAVSLSPLFAAAPALARRLAALRTDPAREAVRIDLRCLDPFSPSEPVIVLDERGTVLGARQAGFAALGLDPGETAQDVARRFQLVDRPTLLQAIERCAGGGEPVGAVLSLEEGGRVGIELTPDSPGLVLMRVDQIVAQVAEETASGPGDGEIPIGAVPEASGCDLGEALAFAISHAAPKARARGVRIASVFFDDIAAAVERRTSRIIVNALLDDAVTCSAADTKIDIAARRTRGAVLVRISFEPDPSDFDVAERLRGIIAHRAVAELVDRARGSLLVEPPNTFGMVGIRLALPAAPGVGRKQQRQEGAACV